MDVVGHKYESFVQREMQKRAAAMRKEVREGLSHTAAARMQQCCCGAFRCSRLQCEAAVHVLGSRRYVDNLNQLLQTLKRPQAFASQRFRDAVGY
jgi:hypothetical protein